MRSPRSSRLSFEAYRTQFREQARQQGLGGQKGGRERSAGMLIREFYGLLRGNRQRLFWSLSTLGVATLLALVPPAATKLVVDNVLGEQPLPGWAPTWFPSEPWPLLATICGIVVTVAVVRITLHIRSRWEATRVAKRLQMSVRRRVVHQAMRLPLHRMHELKAGGAASIVRQDAGSVGELVFGMLYNPFRAAIQLVGSLLVLAWVDWRLLLAALLLVPVVYYSHRTWIARIRPQFKRVRSQREAVDSLATESFSGARVVRAFGRQRAEANRIMRGNHLMGRQELHAWWWMRGIEVVWETLLPLASAGLLLYGGWRVLQGELTVGDLVMFLAYLVMLLGPLAVLAQSAAAFQNSLSGLDRVLDLLAEPLEIQEERVAAKLAKSTCEGAITLENVGFTYPGSDRAALVDVSLRVNQGETIALVGPSGAGKTTLLNLVARFYDPTTGRLLVDGRDLRSWDLESYRRVIGIVDQEVFLFDGTVAENIGYALRGASLDAVRRAADVANATEFIERLPEGFDTLIGERGVRLSGGQRQRLAIARAVLADPRVLIMDEATSNLDTRSERAIQASLELLTQDRTCFLIAHRLSTIAHADRIVVLSGGRIVEIGTHDALLAAGGEYREMVAMQTQPDRNEPERAALSGVSAEADSGQR